MEIAANQKKLQDETKLEAGLNASLELQCRETMERRCLFPISKRKKKHARKNGPLQFKIPAAAVAGQVSFNLK